MCVIILFLHYFAFWGLWVLHLRSAKDPYPKEEHISFPVTINFEDELTLHNPFDFTSKDTSSFPSHPANPSHENTPSTSKDLIVKTQDTKIP